MNTNTAQSASSHPTMARQGSSGGLRKLELNGRYPLMQLNSGSLVGANAGNNPASSGLSGAQGSLPYNRAGNASAGAAQSDAAERSAPADYMSHRPNDFMNPTAGSGFQKQQHQPAMH